MDKKYTYVDLKIHSYMFNKNDFDSIEDFFEYIFEQERYNLEEVSNADMLEGFVRQYEDWVGPWTAEINKAFSDAISDYHQMMVILNSISPEAKNELGENGIDTICDFYLNEAKFAPEEIKPDLFDSWRKFRTVEECVKALGLSSCKTWFDVTEYYPLLDIVETGETLVAV